MKIAHLCLSCFYIDGFSYQENLLSKFHKRAGHDVLLLASTETYLSNKKLGYVKPGSYINGDGIKVIRVEYRKCLPLKVMKKLRLHPRIFKELKHFSPDIIMFHGLCGWEILTAAKYKKSNPSVRLYADSHEDAYNSARNFLSRFLLHGIYYKFVLRQALPYLDQILYVSLDTRDFISKTYGLPDDKMSFFPLGGIIYSDDEYLEKRKISRASLNITEEQIVIVQAGKLEKRKKVIESMDAFSSIRDDRLRLVLVGSLHDEIRHNFQEWLDKDKRILYTGWKKSAELIDLLCAADVYLQPGSQSAIMQNAICARCPVILDDVLSHQPYVDGNGWLLNDKVSLPDVFREISCDSDKLQRMSEKSLEIAKSLLDYSILAQKIVTNDFA